MKYIKGERIWCVSNIQSQVGRPAPVKKNLCCQVVGLSRCLFPNFLVLTFKF